MKNLILILLLIISGSCADSKSDQAQRKKSTGNTRKLQGTETCNCPGPFDEAPHQIKIAYQKNYLKFCAFDFIEAKKLATDFRIFDASDSIDLFPK
jgi:hypothetical protein